MAAVNGDNKLTHPDDSFIDSLWQPTGMFELSVDYDISEEAKAQLESERLDEWRKNIADIRDMYNHL